MTDFLGRVLGEPDSTAIRPRLPSRFEPGLELEPDLDPATRTGPDRHREPEIPSEPPARPGGPQARVYPGPAAAVPTADPGRTVEPAPPQTRTAPPLLGMSGRPHPDRQDSGRGPDRTTGPEPGFAAPTFPPRATGHGRRSVVVEQQPYDRAVLPTRPAPTAGFPVARSPDPAVRGERPRSAARRNPGTGLPPAEETTVHVSIGRVEVRAEVRAEATTPPRRPRQAAPVLGLDEYLRGRAGGGGP